MAKLPIAQEFICPHDSLLTELHGRSGDNGKIGTFIEGTNARLKRLEQELTKLRETQTKLMLIAALGAGSGAGAVTLIAKLIAG